MAFLYRLVGTRTGADLWLLQVAIIVAVISLKTRQKRFLAAGFHSNYRLVGIFLVYVPACRYFWSFCTGWSVLDFGQALGNRCERWLERVPSLA